METYTLVRLNGAEVDEDEVLGGTKGWAPNRNREHK